MNYSVVFLTRWPKMDRSWSHRHGHHSLTKDENSVDTTVSTLFMSNSRKIQGSWHDPLRQSFITQVGLDQGRKYLECTSFLPSTLNRSRRPHHTPRNFRTRFTPTVTLRPPPRDFFVNNSTPYSSTISPFLPLTRSVSLVEHFPLLSYPTFLNLTLFRPHSPSLFRSSWPHLPHRPPFPLLTWRGSDLWYYTVSLERSLYLGHPIYTHTHTL